MMEELVDLDDNALNVNTSMVSQETTDVDTSQNDTQPNTVNVDSNGQLTSFIETGMLMISYVKNLFKIKNWRTSTMCWICSKLTIKQLKISVW